MKNHLDFFSAIQKNELVNYRKSFEEAIEIRLGNRSFGEWQEWENVLNTLPVINEIYYTLDKDIVSVGSNSLMSTEEQHTLHNNLMKLHPWRKGPFQLFDTFIDTEWRSDWKWQRISPFISNLTNRKVLDVGCGSGYHCWRMRGAGASFVLGIDPMAKFLFQFEVFKNYMPKEPVFLLPLMCEDLPANMQVFDTVFSMGVLYHRRSPFDHLEELKQALCKGGELVLETLIVDGDENTVFMPRDRYAQMRNVWFLPSIAALEKWLARAGFTDIRTVNVEQTSLNEQRATEWMKFQSLKDFLDPVDINKTIEGHPAPKRATIIARKN